MEKLSDFLVEGSLVKTKLSKSNDWIPNVINRISVEKNELEIALDERYIASLIMVFIR